MHLEAVEARERRAGLVGRRVGEQLVAHDRGAARPGAHLLHDPVPRAGGVLGEVGEAAVAAHGHRRVDQVEAGPGHEHAGLLEGGAVVLQHLLDEGGARLRGSHVEMYDLRHRCVRTSRADVFGVG